MGKGSAWSEGQRAKPDGLPKIALECCKVIGQNSGMYGIEKRHMIDRALRYPLIYEICT